ncbi:2-polyprenylphenol 6- hydroxylase UbiB4 [Methanobrevibacter ruminantium M1]|uniref:2-polyprenylphenol 6-hydroxylase UbiB4 n=1 Tax=Methanobrevibacter ruminantium (strain ATCC 35063 / DSM 1093 / JCM 13430 / OCM 146 / M1) TaxID=634498 RepID=D3E095_METRM|nr:AarF/ABC1/UbiB kinase family protein [Methanobrevibacter ruminantium]ADC47819.1 2-polyprenylphenol 6- hydroxylase UbiB4 [Methanobrevibacter ruminantium M1]
MGNKEEKKAARQRFDEIIGVAKRHHLAKLLTNNEDDEDFEVSDLRYAMEELGPAFIKLGQLLATRPDMVGNDIADDLKLLRDNTPATPFEEMRKVIEGELGKPLEEVYSEFNEEPLGSASIGQVYRATLKESGMEVAVKVQKPGIYDVIVPDVKILNNLAGTVDKHVSGSRTYNLPAMAKEFERSIFKELDYMEEVRNINKITNNFKDVEYIKIPEVYPEYCSSKLINMELIDGYEVTDLFDNEIEGINNTEIAQYGTQSYLKQVLIDGFFHADPHPGNLFVTKDAKLCYIDFGMMGVVNDTFRSNFAQLILLLLDGNSHHLINQLLYMNIISPEQNTDEFREDVDDLLNSYIGVDLDQMDGIFDNLMNVMINHNIILPREFIMIGRGILLIEDAGNRLDPHFNLTAELEEFAKKMIRTKFEPGNLVGGGFNYIVEIEHLLKDLPDRLNSTLDKVEKGELELNMNHTGLDDLKNQLSIALIVSALLVGSSIAILADKGPKVWDISAIGFFGFLFSAILGAYLVIKYIRK